MRDSAWYGDYLNTRPLDGVRVRIHEFPTQASEAGANLGPGIVNGVRYEEGLTALLQIEEHSSATREEVDSVLKRLLDLIHAEAVNQIEPYD